ncbi:methyl-accepting chemotaxis protein [Canicola haemoglobinophilus]|uniref:Methyl-accepting chemotaxis protein n=1 Tax=Canicola haemoglobinophilus TaxID=733 RepID=A0AB38HCK2_9PAST|nr:hypothetical protein [Canicola haemoglobinophilus]STO55085.1 methyl-accepting chemotaxis protein [Canicola haemoglobinophilus]STO69344.1 methyl-accepting chemotaxis protein [Canicola haemoglobinophilus]
MALPFILAGAAVAAGVFGVKKGLDAKSDLDDAERYSRYAKEEGEEANDKLERQKNSTNSSLETYGETKKKAIEKINEFDSLIFYPNGESRGNQIKAGKKFAEKHPKIIITREEEIEILKELNILDKGLSYDDSIKKINAHNIEMNKLEGALQSLAGGSLAGLAAGGGAWLGVSSLGAASTGAAISGLSGAAATNATLAWLGGGSLASGGLGIAGGTAVLGGLVAGPLLAIGGAVIASKAAETKDAAYEELSRVRGAIKKLEIVISKLESIETYTDLCNSVLNSITSHFKWNTLEDLLELAERNVTFKELNRKERQLVYVAYEITYLLWDFINEPTINEDGDDALPYDERNAVHKAYLMQCKGKIEDVLINP